MCLDDSIEDSAADIACGAGAEMRVSRARCGDVQCIYMKTFVAIVVLFGNVNALL